MLEHRLGEPIATCVMLVSGRAGASHGQYGKPRLEAYRAASSGKLQKTGAMMKKFMLIGVVVVLTLAGLGMGVEAYFKGQAKSGFAAVVARFDQVVSADDASRLSTSIESVQQVIMAAAGRLKGTTWSDADRDEFEKIARARVDGLVGLMCARSVDRKTVHGMDIATVARELRDGLYQMSMQNAGTGKGAALLKVGAAAVWVRDYSNGRPCV